MNGDVAQPAYSGVREIACALDDNVFATPHGSRVTVWSLDDRAGVASFDTVYEFGGERLAIVTDTRPVVAAGAWERHGICAYEGSTGETIWQRRDLRQVQGLYPLPAARVAAGFSDGPLHVLDIATGDTLFKLRGVQAIYADATSQFAVGAGHTGAEWFALYDVLRGGRVWRRAIDTFAVLHAAVAPPGVVVAEATGSLRAFDWAGDEVWKWPPPRGEHVLRVAWHRELAAWMALLWPYGHRRPSVLLTVSADGELVEAVELGRVVAASFLAGGSRLVASRVERDDVITAHVLDVPSGNVVWTFHEGNW